MQGPRRRPVLQDEDGCPERGGVVPVAGEPYLDRMDGVRLSPAALLRRDVTEHRTEGREQRIGIGDEQPVRGP